MKGKTPQTGFYNLNDIINTLLGRVLSEFVDILVAFDKSEANLMMRKEGLSINTLLGAVVSSEP